jgi:hypothetical protein
MQEEKYVLYQNENPICLYDTLEEVVKAFHAFINKLSFIEYSSGYITRVNYETETSASIYGSQINNIISYDKFLHRVNFVLL